MASVTQPASVRGSFSSLSSLQVRPLKAKAPKIVVNIGCVSQEGLYHENEDRMAHGLKLNDQIDGFVGVFDGHGGEECAEYVSANLAKYLGNFFVEGEDFDAGDSTMKDMFHGIEEDFVEMAVEEDDTSGSCATVVVIKGSDALVANIGDIKAVAVENAEGDQDVYQVLTGDHRADAPDENERINRAGGSVVDGRVCNLQPSRSFGDIDVKEIVGEGVVIPTPEVSRVRILPGGFMIVATDGLWDFVDTDAAVLRAKSVLAETDNDPEAAANALVDFAVDCKSADDITVSVIVWLEDDS